MLNDFWLSFVVASFATYRISRMLAQEEGPFELFLSLRTFIYMKWGKDRQWIQVGISCPLCISFYIGFIAAILMTLQLHYEWYAIIWLWFALSGVASFLYKLEQ